MPSSNPAFKKMREAPRPWGGDTQPAGPYAATGQQAMSIQDVVHATAAAGAVAVVAAAAVWALPGQASGAVILGALLAAMVLGLVMSFKQFAHPAATLAYAALEGAALGGISEWFNLTYPGIVVQALIGTAGVVAGMLVVYRTGAIRVTPKLTRWVIAAVFGVLAVLVTNLVVGLFVGGDPLGLRSGGPVAIVFSLLVIGVGAFCLLLDFDLADQAARRGAPARFAWYVAFGLLVTVVWLYLEILRLLSYFNSSD